MTLPRAAVLACAIVAAPQPGPDAHVEAEGLAKSGARAEALQRFQAIVAENPNDVDARLWIGRLHLWMGHPVLAVSVFESILASNPTNVEALTGVAIAHMNAGNMAAAEAALNSAYQILPESAEVLAALGRLHRFEGRLTLALAYYDRAVQQSPADRDIRAARDIVVAQRAHRIEAGYLFEHFNRDVTDTNSGAFEVNLRAADRARVYARAQTQRKFDRTESRGGGGAEWRVNRSTVLRGGGLFSSSAVVLPRADATVDLDVTHGRLTWLLSGRYLHFSTSDAGIGVIGVGWSASDDTTLTVRYFRSETAFNATSEHAGNNAGSIQLSQRAWRQVQIYAGYSRGYESFENVTAETLTQRGAHTFSAGATIAGGPRLAISPSLEIQRRDDPSHVTSFRLTFVHRF